MDLEAAVRKHSEMLYRICIVILGSEQDTQDAIQETFCKYLEKKPKFVDGEHEKAWLIKVATNHCRDIQRFRFRHPKVPIEELAGTLVSRQEDREAVRELLQMPPKQRAVMVLHYVEGYQGRAMENSIFEVNCAVQWGKWRNHGRRFKKVYNSFKGQ